MEGIIVVVCLMFAITSVFSDDRLELSAFEYLRRFGNKPLTLGQCPNRLISYPENPAYNEPCTLPNRKGESTYRDKGVDSQINIPIQDAAELFQHVKMCDDRSAVHFGLLANGDCIATEIADKLSFTPKHATRLFMEHFRPRLNVLLPGELNIPSSYLLYYNNTYYTENISIGTEEILIVQMQFQKEQQTVKANNLKMESKRISENILQIVKHVGMPKKIKVMRLSTSDMDFQMRVFKDQDIDQYASYIEQCEKRITQVHQDLVHGRRSTPLKYGFKAFEIGPIALPLFSATDEGKRKNWEEVALLQVDVSREYNTNKRFNRACRSLKEDHKLFQQEKKLCLLTKQTLKQLKLLTTLIHTQRRDWFTISREQQIQFIEKGNKSVTMLKARMKDFAKELQKSFKRTKANS